MSEKISLLKWENFPKGFSKWKLNPTGARLEVKDLGCGAYALLSSIPGVNNTGFVVGEQGVLVIDAHFSVPMAHQIQERIREVTDKPLTHLVNLNYHGDHTFGNCAFPEETVIIQQRETARRVLFMEEEKDFMTPCVDNDPSIFDGVTLRTADVEFEEYYKVDLGGCVVECHYFGPANTPGDTIVYAPGAKAAWTGNVTGGIFGLALETDAIKFRETLKRFIETLDVEVLVPAHRTMVGAELLQEYLVYFSEVTDGVKQAVRAGWSLEEAMDRVTQSKAFSLPPDDPMAVVMTGRHRYNVKRTYLALAN
ncbi:MAG: MBL fold metallo-hydrolase [Rhodospirillales bacterium]|nr:MBL fold metallo-hydrolase [Rhodospirillales bacterium]